LLLSDLEFAFAVEAAVPRGQLTALFCICIIMDTSAQPAHSAALIKESILQDIGLLKANVFSFWQRHGLDPQHGGFHGTLDLAGAAVDPTSKGLVQQARHQWQVKPVPLGFGKCLNVTVSIATLVIQCISLLRIQ
jgi:hypothetical protein